MEIYRNVERNTLTIEYEINKDEYIIMKHIKDNGYIEFKSNSYGEYEDSRVDTCWILSDHGFIKMDTDSWHLTFNLTDNGQFFIDCAKGY